MKISFPYMGVPFVYKKVLELLGHEVIMPPRPSQRTIDLGVKYSPEFACFPLKVIMGSYIEAIEMGADTIVTSGGHGPCRAGFYGENHNQTLKQLGHDVDFIVFDGWRDNMKRNLQNVKKIKGKNSILKVYKIVRLVYQILKVVDDLEMRIQTLRAYEKLRGTCNKIWDEIQEKLDRVETREQLDEFQKHFNEKLDRVEIQNIPPEEKIRIGIVGEIYVVMEPSINMEIEKVLGDLGVEVRRSQYLSQWVEHNMIPFKKTHEDEILKKGEPWIEIIIGGHAKQTMGHIVDYKEQGFDGIIHLMPFACLPELISQGIMPKISEELDIPVLTIPLDEQTGLANNLTRIEAFVDLLKNKKNNYHKTAVTI